MWTRPCRNIEMEKIFKPYEVDALIPKLDAIFEHMEACQKRIQELAKSRPAEGAHLTAAEIADSARIRSQMEFLLGVVQEDINLITDLGGVVKDLLMGLVDFLGRVAGEEVWLCWKRGEKKVNFWHPLYAGFTERQTLGRPEDKASISH
jgi:hypothetical protein